MLCLSKYFADAWCNMGAFTSTVFISPAKLNIYVLIQLVGILVQGGTIITFRGMSVVWQSNFISPMPFNSISSIHLTLANGVYWTSVFILWKAPPSVKAITQTETISKGPSLELQSFFKGGNPHLLYWSAMQICLIFFFLTCKIKTERKESSLSLQRRERIKCS